MKSKAKEMFEELGYKEKSNNKKYITYTKAKTYCFPNRFSPPDNSGMQK